MTCDDIYAEAIENFHAVRRHAWRAYSAAHIHEDYEDALIMAILALECFNQRGGTC
jgi:hypothetical protein